MLISMTGFGEARYESETLNVVLELRSVNNRYLKVSLRATEPYNLLEGEFEKVIRRFVRRGTIQVFLRCQRQATLQDFQLNGVALRSYLTQLHSVCVELDLLGNLPALLPGVLALPGIVPEPASATLSLEEEWPILEKTLEQALSQLQTMRQDEGKSMAVELLQLQVLLAKRLDHIRSRIPLVATGYRDRLLERVRLALRELDIQIDQKDLIREVGIFADRSDISEEVVRLASHLEQFRDAIEKPDPENSPGRKLEFLAQEMGREANTIGSKAGDVEISRDVVEIKGYLERFRELIQNVE